MSTVHVSWLFAVQRTMPFAAMHTVLLFGLCDQRLVCLYVYNYYRMGFFHLLQCVDDLKNLIIEEINGENDG